MLPPQHKANEPHRKRTSQEIDKVRDLLREYYTANPDEGSKRDIPKVIEKLGLTSKDRVVIASIRKELGLVQAASSSSRHNAVRSINIDALKQAIEFAGNGENLSRILEIIQKAGGVEAIKAALDQYKSLHQILG